MDSEKRLYDYTGDVAMIGVSYGSYPMMSGQTKYQTANNNKKSNGNHSFGTKLINGEYYIHVARDENVRNYSTFPEVDKIRSKYALKENRPLGRHWNLGLQDRFDFITDYQRDVRASKRLHLNKEAAWSQKEVDFLLSFTNGRARPNKIGSAYTVYADSANDNNRYLELYSSAG